MTDRTFKTIVDVVSHNSCTGLRLLSICSIALSNFDIESISDCLKRNATLQELVMVNAKITDNGALLIAEAIHINTTLLVLDISCNQIGYKGAIAIADSLRYNCLLQELNISYNNLTLAGIKCLGESVKANKTLIEVRMMQCCELSLEKSGETSQQNGNETNVFWDRINSFLLIIKCSRLRQKIIIERTDIFDEEVIMAISDCLQNNKVLKYFELFCCILINKKELQDITHDIKNNEEFMNSVDRHSEDFKVKFNELINVAADKIISKRLNKILRVIKENNTLKTLAITCCKIGDEGAAIISDCIAHNTSIRKLDLSHNFITNEGAAMIFKSIEVSKVLQSVDISYNKMSDDGALAASECIKNSPTLLQLTIAHNDLHDIGVIAISDCLKVNTTLQQLSMTTDTISDEAINKLAAALKVNESLNALTIQHGYSDSFNATILSAMYSNSTIMKLTLPSDRTTEEWCVLQNEVERINMVRRSVEIDMLDVTFFEHWSDSPLFDPSHSYSST